MLTLVLRLLRGLFGALSVSGQLWTGPFPPEAQPGVLTGPAPGHPERLCPERPLTEVEAALCRQLPAWGSLSRPGQV